MEFSIPCNNINRAGEVLTGDTSHEKSSKVYRPIRLWCGSKNAANN